jgi:hypothetical protein
MPRSRVDGGTIREWPIITPLALSAGARAARLDESSSLILLIGGLTPFLRPAALVALGVGVQQRQLPRQAAPRRVTVRPEQHREIMAMTAAALWRP